jgi:peptidoglycan/LPS O-acetylase OafA/YrhL
MAVVMVVLLHTWGTVLPGGFIGVDLFFVLSGYLITRLLLKEHRNGGIWLRGFYVRRSLRLLPPLLLTLAVVGLAALLTNDAATLAGVRWNYLANFVRAGGGGLGRLDHLWSLAIEEQFYLLWPPLLTIVLVRRNRSWALGITLGLAVTSMVLRVALFVDGASMARIYSGFDTRVETLLIGCALALLPSLRPSRLLRWSALGVMVCVAVTATANDPAILTFGFTVVAMASAVVILAAQGPWEKALGGRALRQIGRVSYGIYLFHYPLAYWIPGKSVVEFIVVGGASWAMATLSFELIERKILRHDRRWRRPPTSCPVGQS